MNIVESKTYRYSCMPDEEVVDCARNGTDGATEFLISRYRPLVESKAKAYFVIGADHDDVIQEGMIGLCKAIRDFRSDAQHRFKPFAELCVTRQIITAVKTATRYKHNPLNDSISLNQKVGGDAADSALIDLLPEVQRASIGLDRLVQSGEIESWIMEPLSEMEQFVLVSYLEGKSYREMSEERNCRTKSIDNALQRVKRKVGALLESKA
jgi:RNA polymerase sporulation-specific sigma factor